MTQWLRVSALLAALFLLVACQTATRVDEVSGEAPESATLKRVLVVGVDITPVVQQSMEQAFLRALSHKDRSVILASQWFPNESPSRAQMAERIKAEGVTGVLVTRLLAYETRVEQEPSTFSFSLSTPGRDPNERVGWGAPWMDQPPVMPEPVVVKHKAVVETKLYNAESGQVMWQARSRTVMTDDDAPDFAGFAAAITRQLRKSGWLN